MSPAYPTASIPRVAHPPLDRCIRLVSFTAAFLVAPTTGSDTPPTTSILSTPIFLAAIYSIAPPDTRGVLLLQALLGSLSVVFVMLIARRIFGDQSALIAGATSATYSLHPLLQPRFRIAPAKRSDVEGGPGASGYGRRGVRLSLAYERLERTIPAERAFARALQLDFDNAVAAAGLARTQAELESGAPND